MIVYAFLDFKLAILSDKNTIVIVVKTARLGSRMTPLTNSSKYLPTDRASKTGETERGNLDIKEF